MNIIIKLKNGTERITYVKSSFKEFSDEFKRAKEQGDNSFIICEDFICRIDEIQLIETKEHNNTYGLL